MCMLVSRFRFWYTGYNCMHTRVRGMHTYYPMQCVCTGMPVHGNDFVWSIAVSWYGYAYTCIPRYRMHMDMHIPRCSGNMAFKFNLNQREFQLEFECKLESSSFVDMPSGEETCRPVGLDGDFKMASVPDCHCHHCKSHSPSDLPGLHKVWHPCLSPWSCCQWLS